MGLCSLHDEQGSGQDWWQWRTVSISWWWETTSMDCKRRTFPLLQKKKKRNRIPLGQNELSLWPQLGQGYNECSKHVLDLRQSILRVWWGGWFWKLRLRARVREGLCDAVPPRWKFRCVSEAAHSCPHPCLGSEEWISSSVAVCQAFFACSNRIVFDIRKEFVELLLL